MLALTLSNLKMMVRNRHTTFWALFFPLVLVVVFGLFEFDGFGSASITVIDRANNESSLALRASLAKQDFLQINLMEPGEEVARQALQQGKLDYLLLIPSGFGHESDLAAFVEPAQVVLVSGQDDGRSQLIVAAVNHLAAQADGTAGAPTVATETLALPRTRYFDGVLLGLIGLGIMSNSIISIAVKISTYRNQSILKRLLVTPLPIWKYFAAEILAHLLLAVIQAAIILAVGIFIFGAPFPSNWLWLLLVVILGSLIFLNIGFILSAWANTPSAASGMGNAIALPMMFFAGTFFSTASLPWVLPYLAEVLPLTPMISGMRAVSIEGMSLVQIWPELAAMVGWVVVTGLAAVKVFRFS